MRALTELLTVFVAAFLGFFALVASLIGTAAGFLLIAVAGFFSTASLLIALFAGVMFAFTGNHHDRIAAGTPRVAALRAAGRVPSRIESSVGLSPRAPDSGRTGCATYSRRSAAGMACGASGATCRAT
jgi:hypothetical protein